MQHHHDKLLLLIDRLPQYNTPRGVDELSNIFLEYKSILDIVNNTDDNLKRNTSLYYSEITNIEFNIKQSQYAKSKKQKDLAFNDAVSGLKSDIGALATLIENH